MRHVIVGTAGHIDHGKTALVRALTGVDTDRFKEEKERGITIDIGFANLDLDDGTRIGFVDVPGHERFVKNMLAGVGGIDLVMLVVAADESVMPQTREHLDICSLLHIQRGFTVITKVDTVDPEIAELVELEVQDYFKSSFLADAPIVRFSAVTGEGRDRLISTLGSIASGVRSRDTAQVFRLPIDRCFTMKGFGTVVTGTLVAGSIGNEDPVVLLPSGGSARIRGIQVHGRAVEHARAGQRTALNLQGVDVSEVERGMVLASPGTLRASSIIDCRLELLGSAPKAIHRRKRIRFHIGTAEVLGYVYLVGAERLEPGETGLAEIRLEQPTVAVPGDRFIVRQYSPMRTIGGGQVLESVDRKRRRLQDPAVVARLERLSVADGTDRVRLLVEESSLKAITESEIVARTGSAPDAIRAELDALVEGDEVRRLGAGSGTVMTEAAFGDAAARVMRAVETFHREHPLEAGISREALLVGAIPEASSLVFDFVLGELVRSERIETAKEIVHLHGRRVELRADEEELRDAILAALAGYGIEVPEIGEVLQTAGIDPGKTRTILQFMVRDRSVARISDSLIVDQRVIDDLVARLRERKSTNPNLGVGDFKDLAGVTRKYAIPLLEYFDRIRVTRRNGNDRLIL